MENVLGVIGIVAMIVSQITFIAFYFSGSKDGSYEHVALDGTIYKIDKNGTRKVSGYKYRG